MKTKRLSPIPSNPLAVIYSLVQQTIGLVNSRTNKIQNSEGRHFFSPRKDLSRNSHSIVYQPGSSKSKFHSQLLSQNHQLRLLIPVHIHSNLTCQNCHALLLLQLLLNNSLTTPAEGITARNPPPRYLTSFSKTLCLPNQSTLATSLTSTNPAACRTQPRTLP
jgi:hypothetical protein